MTGSDQRQGQGESRVFPLQGTDDNRLLYVVELWNMARTAPERVLGRAASVVLARAIFAAAQTEHLGRRILLRRGGRVLEEAG